jgi:hypothetical protein
VITVLGLAGALVTVAMARTRGHGLVRRALLGFAFTASAALALLIPDYRVLMAVAYALIFLVGAPFGWPTADYFEIALLWPVVNQFVCIAGGAAI